MIIDCDDREIEKRLIRLQEIVNSLGAFFHRALTLRCRDGEFSLHSAVAEADRSLLIKLPPEALPLVDAFQLHVHGDDICIGEIKRSVSKEQQRIMELMTEIYNLSGKIALALKQSPWICLADCPEALRMLSESREGCRKSEKRWSYLEAGAIDDLLLSVFIGSRTFKSRVPPGEVLMPFVDCINHHFSSPGFMTAERGSGSGVSVFNAKPKNGSDEVFVSYFPVMDSLDSWLYFSFIDELSPVVKSVPLKLEVGEGKKIIVKGLFGAGKEVPEKLRDIRVFVPSLIEKNEGSLMVSRLIIPHGGAPFSLRRILGALIKTLRPELSGDGILEQVEKSEKALIDGNMAFYNNLSEVADHPEGLTMAGLGPLIKTQTGKIQSYRVRHNLH